MTAKILAKTVLDRSIEVFGVGGVADDTPIAHLSGLARALRIVDSSDAVHRRTMAGQEPRRYQPGQLLPQSA